MRAVNPAPFDVILNEKSEYILKECIVQLGFEDRAAGPKTSSEVQLGPPSREKRFKRAPGVIINFWI